ncbi:MAG: hypothetical protein ACOCRK_02105 [bacterium]
MYFKNIEYYIITNGDSEPSYNNLSEYRKLEIDLFRNKNGKLDYGADIIVKYTDGMYDLIQCKNYKDDEHLNNSNIEHIMNYNHPKIRNRYLFTSSEKYTYNGKFKEIKTINNSFFKEITDKEKNKSLSEKIFIGVPLSLLFIAGMKSLDSNKNKYFLKVKKELNIIYEDNLPDDLKEHSKYITFFKNNTIYYILYYKIFHLKIDDRIFKRLESITAGTKYDYKVVSYVNQLPDNIKQYSSKYIKIDYQA